MQHSRSYTAALLPLTTLARTRATDGVCVRVCLRACVCVCVRLRRCASARMRGRGSCARVLRACVRASVRGVSGCAFEGVRVSLLLRGALGMLRLLGCTLRYSRGTPRKGVRACGCAHVGRSGGPSNSVEGYSEGTQGYSRVLEGYSHGVLWVLTWGTLGYSHRPIVRSIS